MAPGWDVSTIELQAHLLFCFDSTPNLPRLYPYSASSCILLPLYSYPAPILLLL